MFKRLYLHIPFCLHKCPYCAFVSQESSDDLGYYTDLLLEEMRLAACQHTLHNRLESIYFGGGTPSLLKPEDVARIIELATDLFGLSNQVEITLEANPGTVNREKLTGYHSAGVNRLSMGVQSLDDRILTTLGRIHTTQQALDAYKIARAAGFANIGIDLIHATPGQTMDMWCTDLEQIRQLAPEHISVYGLTVEECTPFADRFPEGSFLLPSDEQAARMFETADDLLKSFGYEHYEIANYARPGFYSQHNCGYWHRDGYLGLGAGAHSYLRDNDYGSRCFNSPELKSYDSTIRQGSLARQDLTPLSREDAMAEYMFLGLRMAGGVELSRFEREFDVSFENYYGKVMSKLEPSGLLEVVADRLFLTRRGMLLSNQVFACFI